MTERVSTPAIRACIDEFSMEFGDHGHRRSNLTHAVKLQAQSGLLEAAFVACLYEARAITRDQLTAKRLRRPMAYYFSVVRDLVGLEKESQTVQVLSDSSNPETGARAS
jgi:hypothetical protein